MLDIKPCVLKGKYIQLEPLNEIHKEELNCIAQNESIWTYTPSKPLGNDFDAYFNKAISLSSNQQHLPFIVRCLQGNTIVGSTRFYDISAEHHRLTIGYTWFIPAVWGAHANPESKLLLLTFAFENCLVNRVEFMIDVRNLRSRAAIKKLGATEEGVLRQHMILKDDYIRDTAIYSIVKSEWLDLKSNLMKRLEINP